MIKNILRRNKHFLFSQAPQLIIFLFLLFLILIAGESNKDRLYSFATEPVTSDITASYRISDITFFDVFPTWEERVIIKYNTSFSLWQRVITFDLSTINGSYYLGGQLISSSVTVLAFSSFYNLTSNQAYIYGDLFSKAGISEGMKLNISTIMANTSSKSFSFEIKGVLSKIPSFVNSYCQQFHNFIIVNTSILKDYFTPFSISGVPFSLTGIISFLFSFEFKNNFLIRERVEDFTRNVQSILNSTTDELQTSRVMLIWDTDSFFNRINLLQQKLLSDMKFYALSSIPLFVLVLCSYIPNT